MRSSVLNPHLSHIERSLANWNVCQLSRTGTFKNPAIRLTAEEPENCINHEKEEKNNDVGEEYE